jgi:hypothetical protein
MPNTMRSMRLLPRRALPIRHPSSNGANQIFWRATVAESRPRLAKGSTLDCNQIAIARMERFKKKSECKVSLGKNASPNQANHDPA